MTHPSPAPHGFAVAYDDAHTLTYTTGAEAAFTTTHFLLLTGKANLEKLHAWLCHNPGEGFSLIHSEKNPPSADWLQLAHEEICRALGDIELTASNRTELSPAH